MYAALRYTTQMSKQMCNLVTLGSGSFSWSLRQVFQSKTMHTDGPYIQVSLSLLLSNIHTHTHGALLGTHTCTVGYIRSHPAVAAFFLNVKPLKSSISPTTVKRILVTSVKIDFSRTFSVPSLLFLQNNSQWEIDFCLKTDSMTAKPFNSKHLLRVRKKRTR